MELTRAAAEVAQTAVERRDITIDFDASAQTYTLRFGSTEQKFGPADLTQESGDGLAAYQIDTASGRQFLSIYTVPFISASFATDLDYNQYVAQAYWQLDSADNSSQFTRFFAFVFGDETDPAEMPTTGSAHWLVDIFGALAKPGEELLTISGTGDFEVDFKQGVYQFMSSVTETEFQTFGGTAGALYLQSSGKLQADGTFGGPLAYDGTATLDGSLSGRFFGPGAAELGATFEATDSNGTTLNGSFTGQRSTFASTSAGISNITLTDPLTEGRTFGEGVEGHISYRSDDPEDFADIGYISREGVVTYDGNGVISVSGNFYRVLAEEDRIADSSGKFDRYAYSDEEGEYELALYKLGDANPEIALTYASFYTQTAIEESPTPNATVLRREDRFVHWGLRTMPEIIRATSGTARYGGVVYGRANRADRAQFEVGGTSAFTIDFGAGSYDGQLVLTGTEVGQGGQVDLGTWTFGSEIRSGFIARANMSATVGGKPGYGQIFPTLYGPNAEEIGADFEATVENGLGDPMRLDIFGVTVGRRED